MTLIEVAIVTITAIVVSLALFAIQDLTLRQTTRVFAQVDATQRARTAMETIANRLHSACVAESVSPIQEDSTSTSLSFTSKYGSSASLTPEKHVIALNTSDGTLTDSTYAVSGGTAPNWVFSTTASSTTTLLTNVSQGDSTPLFRYYAFGIAKDSGAADYLDASGSPYMILLDGAGTLPSGVTTSTGAPVSPGTIPANSTAAGLPAAPPNGLSAADAKIASAVNITMVVDAAGGLGANPNNDNAPVTMSDTLALRITALPSEGNLPTVPPCA